MKIPYLSGLRVSGEVELKNLQELNNATRFLTIDANNNVKWSVGSSGGGNVDLSNYLTKAQSDSRFQPLGNYLTSVSWSMINDRPAALSQFTNDAGYITSFTESDTLDSVLGRGNTSNKNITVTGKATFSNELIIPTNQSSSNNSIWLGTANSTGYTPSPSVGILNDLADVTISAPINGQALVFNGFEWINQSVVTNLSNYFTKSESDSKYQPIGNYLTSVSWNDILNKPNIPTLVSQLTNDSGFVTASIVNGYATQTYVNNSIANLISSAPSTLDTLYELANALGNDPNFSTTVLSQIGTKANASDVYNKSTSDSRYQPLENQRLSTANNVSFNKVTAVNELIIPSTASASNNSIWLGNANSNGNTPTPSANYLRDLLDVDFGALQNGQSIQYDSGTWKNVSLQIAGNYATTDGANINVASFRSYLGLGTNAYLSGQIEAEYISGGAQLPNYFGSNRLKLNMLWHNGTWNDALWMSSYSGGDVKGSNQILFGKIADSIGFRRQNFDSDTWGAYNEIYHSANIPTLKTALNLNAYILEDGVSYAGFVAGNAQNPYMRHKATNEVVNLVRASQLGSFAYRNSIDGNEVGTYEAFPSADVLVAKLLRWKNYGANHTIFDASNGTAPDGTAIDRNNSTHHWGSSYPTLMGWNGGATYGVRVDSARQADNATFWNGKAVNYASFTSSSEITNLLGVNGPNGIVSGFSKEAVQSWLSLGASAYVAETLDSVAIRNPNLYRTIHIRGGNSLFYWNAANTYAARADMRDDVLHQYVDHSSGAVAWKENWWDGSKYHSAYATGEGFGFGSKILALGGSNGALTYQGGIEVRGTNAGITFHYPGFVASNLYVNQGNTLHWTGGGIHGGGFIQANRVIAGYDSGVAGSVNASDWFRSEGNSGWFSASHGGGIWMTDNYWLRVYNGKAFLVENRIHSTTQVDAPTVIASSKMVIPTSAPASPEAGCIWIA